MYPTSPYPGFSWSLFQHLGPISNPNTLFQTLLAAAMYRDTQDPPSEINQYLVANKILTPNIRKDSGQSDAWRDYQQILSELALIYSTDVEPRITPTSLGLAYLDGTLSFAEVMTLQALRYQYPNGHKVVISARQRTALAGTSHVAATKLTELQQITGVQIRPGVLVWSVLRLLAAQNQTARLTVDEIQNHLMRCSTHADTNACVSSIVATRAGAAVLPVMPHARRNAQDWIKLLQLTPIFSGGNSYIQISSYGVSHAADIDAICSTLQVPASFWTPTAGTLSIADRRRWYAEFGSVNLDVALIPQSDEVTPPSEHQEEEDAKELSASAGQAISLRDFDARALGATHENDGQAGRTITSTYDAGLANNMHRLHDLMVIYIARTCNDKGAHVYDDPNSVDLLIDHQGSEYIVEVKSVTPRNFIGRLRYALGQVQHYDYLRSLQSQAERRKVIALAAQISSASWCIPFVNDHLDMDLISLEGQILRVDSRHDLTKELFTPNAPDLSLGV